MSENKSLRVSVADAKDFERGSFKTYSLDESNGVSVVVAKDSKDKVTKAQSFVFDLTKNANWDFTKAQAYATASLVDVNKLAAATRGSIAFKTLAQAAASGEPIAADKIRHGLRLASIDPAVADLLVAKQKDEKAAEIDFEKVQQHSAQ